MKRFNLANDLGFLIGLSDSSLRRQAADHKKMVDQQLTMTKYDDIRKNFQRGPHIWKSLEYV